MTVVFQTPNPSFFSDQQLIEWHQDQATHYCEKFNSLPICSVKRRELAQILCELHSARALKLGAGAISRADLYTEYSEIGRGRGIKINLNGIR